ncbi:MAG TPA: hypothetical protein VMB81_07925 [Candidatus Sulfotelmatobacter sp.]|nr:hypothetical protein [Candidatus Sulfotelmatobacter sp.]
MTGPVIVPLWAFLFLPWLLFGAAFTALTLLWLVLIVPAFLVWLWILARICRKAGYSGWWSLTTLVPPLFAILIWALAFADWPLGPPRIQIIPPRR